MLFKGHFYTFWLANLSVRIWLQARGDRFFIDLSTSSALFTDLLRYKSEACLMCLEPPVIGILGASCLFCLFVFKWQIILLRFASSDRMAVFA